MKNKKVLISVVIAVLLIAITIGTVIIIKNNNQEKNVQTENVMEKPTRGMEALPTEPEPDNPDGTRPPEDPLGRQGIPKPSDPGTGNPKPPTE